MKNIQQHRPTVYVMVYIWRHSLRSVYIENKTPVKPERTRNSCKLERLRFP